MIRLDLEGPTPNQPHLTLCAMLRTYFMSLFSIVNSTIHSNSLLKHIFKWQKASSTTFYCRDCRIVSDNAWTQKTLYKIYDKREHNGCRNCSLYQGDQWYLVRPLILVCTCQPSCCVLSVALFEHVCKEKWWKQALWCLFWGIYFLILLRVPPSWSHPNLITTQRPITKYHHTWG